MKLLGYVGANEGNQTFEVAYRMKWLVASLYTFSALAMFLSITFIYNLNKKKVAIMTQELTERRASSIKTIIDNTPTTEEIVQGAEEIISQKDIDKSNE